MVSAKVRKKVPKKERVRSVEQGGVAKSEARGAVRSVTAGLMMKGAKGEKAARRSRGSTARDDRATKEKRGAKSAAF
jgi:hypothetical protein